MLRTCLLPILALALPPMAQAQTLASGAPDVAPAPGLTARAAPQLDPALWFTRDDYHPAALRAEQEGRVGLLLDIGVDGRVSGCTVLASSGAQLLDRESCRLVTRRARFTPALGKGRKPVPDRWNASIEWKLLPDMIFPPRNEVICDDCGIAWTVPPSFWERSRPPVAYDNPDNWVRRADLPAELRATGGSATVELRLDRLGKISGCRIRDASGLGAWSREICPLLRSRARFDPGRNREDKAIRSRWKHRYIWPAAPAG